MQVVLYLAERDAVTLMCSIDPKNRHVIGRRSTGSAFGRAWRDHLKVSFFSLEHYHINSIVDLSTIPITRTMVIVLGR